MNDDDGMVNFLVGFSVALLAAFLLAHIAAPFWYLMEN